MTQTDFWDHVQTKTKPKPKKASPTGHVIYEGASLLDGKPIVVIAIHHSKNIKTVV